ncbi:uncharacterized protein LOC133742369 [Rosa rugosa]|uniref:uncharacterized protein LOC133742369 n=1 Tax=Rosa rugosa TaxID=74645 RepID=UPI002B40F9FA|nr:uncharacterized protein LOC133742369 [Rosa rugosa]
MAEQSRVISQFQPHVAAQLVPVKLTEDNYSLWSSLVVPVLKNYDMFNMVQGIEQPLTEDKDQKCMSFMKLTLSEAMLPYAAESCSSSRALWLKLEEQGGIAKFRLVQLSIRLKKLKKGKFTSMSKYYQMKKNMADRLKAAGSPVADSDFIEQVLNGLPSEYDAFANSIIAGIDDLTPEELHDLLVVEESNRKGELFRTVIKYGALALITTAIIYHKGLSDARARR